MIAYDFALRLLRSTDLSENVDLIDCCCTLVLEDEAKSTSLESRDIAFFSEALLAIGTGTRTGSGSGEAAGAAADN